MKKSNPRIFEFPISFRVEACEELAAELSRLRQPGVDAEALFPEVRDRVQEICRKYAVDDRHGEWPVEAPSDYEK